MNKRKIFLSVIVIAAMAAMVMALVPPPPANQFAWKYDASIVNVSAATCIECHGIENIPIRHHLLQAEPGFPYGCQDCHPNQGVAPNQTMYIERDCTQCHGGFAFPANPNVNISTLKPHHNTAEALARDCVHCHGISTVDNFDTPGLYRPTYSTSIVTPFADNKVWNATGLNPNNPANAGRYWGGCLSCHQNSTNVPAGAPNILSNHDTHHNAIGNTAGKCNWCHVINESNPSGQSVARVMAKAGQAGPLNGLGSTSYPLGRILEFRNSSVSAINGTGCENCHSVRSLHNIQVAATGLNVSQTIANKVSGWGHIASNADCNGCHAFWSAGAVNPFPGPISLNLESVTPSKVIAGTTTDVTLIGINFVQDKYTTTVLIGEVSLTPKFITDTQIVVTVPTTLAAGTYNVQVDKGGVTSALSTLTVAAPVTIASAQLTSGVVTITGTGFGTVDQKTVVFKKASRAIITSDSITNWVDTKIVAASAKAAVGDTVTVTTPTGAATATITGGAVLDSVTVTYPNAAGVTWKRGASKTVTWNKAGTHQATNVKIDLMQGTSVKRTLASKTPNDGSQSVSIPSSMSTGYYTIRVTSSSHTPTYSDSSDKIFQVTR